MTSAAVAHVPVEVHVYTPVVFHDEHAGLVAQEYILDNSCLQVTADGCAAIVDTHHAVTVAPETCTSDFLCAVYSFVRTRALRQCELFIRLDLVRHSAPPAPTHAIARDALMDIVGFERTQS